MILLGFHMQTLINRMYINTINCDLLSENPTSLSYYQTSSYLLFIA